MGTRLRLRLEDEGGRSRLSPILVESLITRLAECGDATFVTLEGNGSRFCEGMDLASLAEADADVRTALDRFADLLAAIEQGPHPVIALVNGPAMGGGVGLAAAADLVIAGPNATFGLPECLFGLIPAMVFPVLARRVGHTRSRWLALSARTLTVEEAFRIGLVDEVAEDVEAALARHAPRLERLDRQAIGAAKKIAAQHASTDVAYRDRAAALFQQLLDRSETRERISRFLEGGTPWPDRGTSSP